MVTWEPEQNVKSPAVYIPFKSFLTATETLAQGLPPKLDRSVWPSFSGSAQSHTLSAFRFLNLIDNDGNVQPDLDRLVKATGEQRKAMVKGLLEKCYPDIVSLGRDNASPQQLQEAMRRYGVQGGTLDKAIRFFLEAATFGDLQRSPLWVKGKKVTTSGARRPDRRGTNLKKGPGGSTGSSPPQSNPSAMQDGSKKTVKLRSGGTATLSVTVDPLSLSVEDRKWLFELIDKLRDYEMEAHNGRQP